MWLVNRTPGRLTSSLINLRCDFCLNHLVTRVQGGHGRGVQILFRRRLRKTMRTPYCRGWGKGEKSPPSLASVLEQRKQKAAARLAGPFTPCTHCPSVPFAGLAAPPAKDL